MQKVQKMAKQKASDMKREIWWMQGPKLVLSNISCTRQEDCETLTLFTEQKWRRAPLRLNLQLHTWLGPPDQHPGSLSRKRQGEEREKERKKHDTAVDVL